MPDAGRRGRLAHAVYERCSRERYPCTRDKPADTAQLFKRYRVRGVQVGRAGALYKDLHDRLHEATSVISDISRSEKRLRKMWKKSKREDALFGNNFPKSAAQCPSVCTASTAWEMAGDILKKYKPAPYHYCKNALQKLLIR